MLGENPVLKSVMTCVVAARGGGLFGFGTQKAPAPEAAEAAPAPPPKPAAPPAKAPVNDALAARKAEQERIMAERKAAQEARRAEQQAAIAARKAEQERIRAEQLAKRNAAQAPAPAAKAAPTPPPKQAAAPGLRPPPPAKKAAAPAPPPKQAAPAASQRQMSAPRGAPVAKEVGRLKYADQIGLNFPASWSEGQDFQIGGVLAAGDLVGVTRSDGSIKFGQIVGKAGFIGNNWEVCVATNANGAPQQSRTESGAKLRKVLPAAMMGVVAFGETPERAEPIDIVEGTQMVEPSGFKTNFFQRLGSMSPTIGGAQRDKTVPLPPPQRSAPPPPPRNDPSVLKPQEPPAKPAAPVAKEPAKPAGFLGGLFGGGAPAKAAAPPVKAPAPPLRKAVAPPRKAVAPPPKKAPAAPPKAAAPAPPPKAAAPPPKAAAPPPAKAAAPAGASRKGQCRKSEDRSSPAQVV